MRIGAEAHEGADHKPPRPLDRIVRGLVGNLEFAPGERRQPQQFDQPARLRGILQHPEQPDDVVIEVVVNLGMAARLVQQHAGAAAERLGIEPMCRQVRDDLPRHQELGAVPSYRWAGDRVHASTTTVSHEGVPSL